MLQGLALLLAGLAVAVVLDSALLAVYGARILDPWLIIVVAAATRGRKADAMLVASLVGLVQDLQGDVFGVHLLSKVTVAYLASMVAGRLIPGQPLTAVVLLAGGTIVEELVIMTAGVVLGQQLNVRSPGELGMSVLFNVLVGTAVLALLERRRQKRPHPAHARAR